MKTSKARLKWLVEFSQDKRFRNFPTGALLASNSSQVPPEFKAWEWLKLKDEVAQFIGQPDEWFQYELCSPEEELAEMRLGYQERDLSEELTQKTIRTMQSVAALNIQHVVLGMRNKDLSPGEGTITRYRLQMAYDLKTGHVAIRATANALFEIRLMFVLRDEASKISGCPECSTSFYRNRKQIYCSKACTDKVARREWLKNPENRQKDADWAHERYKRRKPANTRARIVRRPRIKATKKGKHGKKTPKEK